MPIATKSSKIDISKEIITQKIAEKIASKVSKIQLCFFMETSELVRLHLLGI